MKKLIVLALAALTLASCVPIWTCGPGGGHGGPQGGPGPSQPR
ncbi:hypothetical protein [Psittacicella hinzii]|nr:hypothetical protein [Psittacicella hinzii]